ncbi:hypothetical protein IKG02_03635 [Candidatus Saccharibacteria bacterium]|nr:hypothetical protein [Candidatus Saccharibacteria bacterium]
MEIEVETEVAVILLLLSRDNFSPEPPASRSRFPRVSDNLELDFLKLTSLSVSEDNLLGSSDRKFREIGLFYQFITDIRLFLDVDVRKVVTNFDGTSPLPRVLIKDTLLRNF